MRVPAIAQKLGSHAPRPEIYGAIPMEESRASIIAISRILEHSNLTMTMRYTTLKIHPKKQSTIGEFHSDLSNFRSSEKSDNGYNISGVS